MPPDEPWRMGDELDEMLTYILEGKLLATPETAENYVPPSMQPFTPTPFELPEIPGMKLIKDHPLLGGRQAIVEMSNGWQVSIVNHWGAYGGLEVGFYPPYSGHHLGAPPFHDDEVMGHLDQQSLVEVLSKVHHLPKEHK